MKAYLEEARVDLKKISNVVTFFVIMTKKIDTEKFFFIFYFINNISHVMNVLYIYNK